MASLPALAFTTLESYRSLNLDITGIWNYEDRADAIGFVAAEMKQHASMRLVKTRGYCDLTTPVYGVEYSFDQLGVDRTRTRRVVLAGAADPENRRLRGRDNLSEKRRSVHTSRSKCRPAHQKRNRPQ